MTAAVAALALAVTALGLAVVPSAAALARLLAWAVALAFAVFALVPPLRTEAVAEVPVPVVALAGDATAVRTAALAAAAVATPAAAAIALQWQAPLATVPEGAFGAALQLPAPLPFAPQQLQVALASPPQQGRPVLLHVQAPALAAPLAADVVVRRGAETVHRATVALGGGAASTSFVPEGDGAHTVELTVAAAGHRVRGTGAFVVAAAPRLFVVEPSGIVVAAAQAQGLAATAGPALPDDLTPYQAVVLGAPLPAAAQERLAAAVRDGLGLFVLAPGFGAPGEPLRALLPLRPAPQQPDPSGDGVAEARGGDTPPPAAPQPKAPEPPQPPRGDTRGAGRVGNEPIEVDKRAVAMVLVVDRSGSMGAPLADGRTKMSYAKTSALRTAQALGEGDRVGLVTFGNKDQGRVVLPLTSATDTAAVRSGIEQLAHANEFTYLLGGLRAAYDLLASADAAVKHVVVISDGEFDVQEDLALGKLAREMRSRRKVTLSLIALVDDDTDSSFLKLAERLREAGGGDFFQVRDPGAVPAFVSAEVTRSLQRVGRQPRDGRGAPEPAPAVSPPTPEPTPPEPPPPSPTPPPPATPARLAVRPVAQSPLLAPEPAGAWPSLGRAVAGESPLDARVLLVAGDDGWPLLAYANRGLGRVGAFAADLAGPDGAEFRAEAAFPARLAQWLSHVLPALPEAAPAPLLQDHDVAPPAPTPAEALALTALAGVAPVANPAPRVPRFDHSLAPTLPWAGAWLVAALVLVAAVERLLAGRAVRRSQ